MPRADAFVRSGRRDLQCNTFASTKLVRLRAHQPPESVNSFPAFNYPSFSERFTLERIDPALSV